MSALSIQPTYPIFTDIDGQPLEDGYIWIGVANLAPIGNPINVYWDAALTIPAVQPIRTRGGYPVNSGTPARLYVNSDYSIQVQNKNGSVVYSAATATERYSQVVVTGLDFTQAGTGAVTRTVQSKLEEWVSVQDFGADPTGGVSSVTAIQNAVDTGKNVFFPAGTYLIDATITVSGNSQTLFGNGINSKLVAPVDINGFTWFDTGVSANANIEFTGLFFIGNGTSRLVNGNTGNDYVLSIQNSEAVRIINNKFEDCFAQTQAGKAVWVWSGSQNVMVANNFFANNSGQDVNFYGSNGSVYRCTAMNNIHFNTQGECYEVEGRNALTIAGYEVYDCTFIGNQIRSSIPTITAAGSHGFLCIGGRGIKYIGNTVNRRGENGISLIGSQNVLIEGNQFQDLSRTGRNGILMNTDLFGASGSNFAVQIVGNTFANGIDNAAINCHAGDTASISNRVIITNNQISNSTTGIATGYVQDITIADNTIDNSTVTTPVSIGTGTNFQKGKMDNIDTTGVLVMPYVAKTFGFSDISGAYTFDVSTGTTTFLHTLTGNVTSIAHVGTPKIGMEVTLVFNQGGAFTLPAAANWTNIELAGLTAPVMTAIPGRKDVIKFVWSGTRWIEICRAANVGV